MLSIKIRKIIIYLAFFAAISVVFLIFQNAVAQTDKKLEIRFFYSSTCPFCMAEKTFLSGLEKKYPEINIIKYEINNPESAKILIEMAKEFNAERYLGIVPLTFIGKDFLVGFDNPKNAGKSIENSIQKQLKLQANAASSIIPPELKRNIPLIGELNLKQYSLPVLAIILGIIDGVNVCSLGALILILSLVLILNSRKKVIVFGGIYILITAATYGLLIILWYKLFSFFAPYMRAMEAVIGILGIIGGAYLLKEFIRFMKNKATCELSGSPLVLSMTKKLQQAFENPNKALAIAGSIGLFAFVLTVIEFPCSAATPMIFAGILAKSQLPSITHFLYMALFLVFYMIDEIVIFLIAIYKMTIWFSSPKFMIWATLAGSIILFSLGGYYLVNLLF